MTARLRASGEDALPWLLALTGGLLLLVGAWLLGPTVGDLLFRGRPLHPLPAYAPAVKPKPAEFGRYAIAIAIVFLVASLVLAAPRRRELGAFGLLRRFATPGVIVAQLAALGALVWAWRGQNEGINYLTTVQFHVPRLIVAVALAGVVVFAVRGRWLGRVGSRVRGRHGAGWPLLAAIVTALWLAPALFKATNLAHSMTAVWYPLQFTFDDFLSVLDGRTPLVNYDAQYASLLPFATEPALRLLGASVGAFTALMCAMSLASFMCVERALARVARDERTALLLYLPVLAVSLLTLRHGVDQRYFMGDYYEVVPIRYFGPFVLLWLLVRQLAGKWPRRPAVLFLLGGLVAINNTEFGLPALGGCLLALAGARAVPHTGTGRRLLRLCAELAVGLLIALASVTVFLVLRTGTPPQLSRLTRYEQIYAITGFNLVPTPTAGLHVVIFMTLAASLVVASVRIRRESPDRLMTGTLIFAGTFGLGAGAYFVGRSFPEVLAAMFPAWGLAAALLCLIALRSIDPAPGSRRAWPLLALPVLAPTVLLALMATTIDQFPAPWTQWRRIEQRAHTVLFDVGPSVHFVRATSKPRAHVALLTGLGHLIGLDANVVDVSPYSHPDGIVTYEQLDDVLSALRSNRGNTVYVGDVVPEVTQVLSAHGFRAVAHDPTSSLTMWSKASRHRA